MPNTFATQHFFPLSDWGLERAGEGGGGGGQSVRSSCTWSLLTFYFLLILASTRKEGCSGAFIVHIDVAIRTMICSIPNGQMNKLHHNCSMKHLNTGGCDGYDSDSKFAKAVF